KYLISNSSYEISYSKLRRIFGVTSKHTIQDWISFMEQAYIIFKLERFSFKLKESIIAPKKVYAIDPGFMNTVSSDTSKSRSIETIVAIELLRRNYYARHAERQLNYWKSHRQEEVDFVIRKKSKVLELIQVTYASKEADIRGKEIENLVTASTELKCNNLSIITWDYKSKITIRENTINCIPLWEWLLALK
ncbi:MAG: ATP-binding protein, partial [Candidatus Micrarchaeota archaeon]|nr:ATP-binding protein [Candidatus Micrarchaeota archaeon]